jgi:Holliday junction resolvase RusA-like endonuclease
VAGVNGSVTIMLLGKPVPGTRAQSKYRWIPKNQQHAMDQLRVAASDAMKDRPMLTGPLLFLMLAEIPIPSSWSKKKQREASMGTVWPTVTPDLKNLLWLAEDACKSVVYSDDKLICKHITMKRYSLQPKIVLTIEMIGFESWRLVKNL